ncbi:MAG: 50S ribosomal protein L5 [Phycisphaerales bacterium]|nr:50S ribosomal protein L5 [Phycisphaerales bacterium]
MVAQKTKPRLQTLYDEQALPAIAKAFGLKNALEMPRISKVIVMVGIGKQLENQKLKPEVRDTVVDTLQTITGQRPIMLIAKKSVSNFKVREGAPSAFMVTLRRDRMWHFLDRLINLAIPRIKDFRGLKDSSFDQGGNYGMGLTEQAVWPEINMANVNFTHGMHVNIVFERSDPEKSREALRSIGMPFVRREGETPNA